MARIPGIDAAVAVVRVAAPVAQQTLVATAPVVQRTVQQVVVTAAPVAQRTAQQAVGIAVTTGVGVVSSVAGAVSGAVSGTVDTATQARDTVAALHRLAIRAEAIAGELEEPLMALKPGLVRLAEVLDDPMISDVPETLRRVQEDVLPVLRTLADTHDKVATIAGSTDRIMTFVDDTSRTIAHLPGASLLSRRKTPTAVRTVVVEELDR